MLLPGSDATPWTEHGPWADGASTYRARMVLATPTDADGLASAFLLSPYAKETAMFDWRLATFLDGRHLTFVTESDREMIFAHVFARLGQVRGGRPILTGPHRRLTAPSH